jgi:MFS family permease
MADTCSQSSSACPLEAREVTLRHRRVFFFGWWVVLAAAVGLFWGVPVTVFSFTAFLKPLMQEFHAGRAAVSLAFTLQLIVGALSNPLAGWLIGRYGARKVVLPATAIFGALLLSVIAFSSGLWRMYVFYTALGFVIPGLGPLPYGCVVSHWFDRRRGLALGLMMVGIGSGAMIMPLLTQQLVARLGWRAAYETLGGAVLLISIPVVAAFLKEKPQDLGLLSDGAAPNESTAEQEPAAQGLTAREAWHTGTFWVMVCAFFLVSASVQGCLVHTIAMLSDRGISAQKAALGSSLAGASVLIGRVFTGYLLDRLFAPRVAAAFFGSAALGIGLLWLGTTPIAFAGAFLVGLGLGAEVDIIAYLTSRYFGLRAFGQIYSWAFAAFALAGALGPLLMGASFDRTGSYHGALATFLAATVAAAVFMTRLGPYRYRVGQLEGNQPILQAKAEGGPYRV